ncbi:TetR/AcrR family transcriptional regulator (plasmid) [Nocardioides sp. R1-1]|uniref:TetR/AcrR family transcriptional regulator n=1 Tax=Nocardioides sp. R1-1 TaxID=3383502 RepID=UPI0038D21762
MAVFPRMGYHGATVRDLASAGGITVPTLYYYHGDKQRILFDLLRLGLRELLDRAAQARASVAPDVDAELDRMVEVAVLHVVHRRQLATIESETRFLEPHNRAEYLAMRSQFDDQFLEIIERGVDEGLFRLSYPREACRAILGMIHSVAMWYQPAGSLSPPEVAHRHVRAARRIVGASLVDDGRSAGGSGSSWGPPA